jgi:hypothetical protein
MLEAMGVRAIGADVVLSHCVQDGAMAARERLLELEAKNRELIGEHIKTCKGRGVHTIWGGWRLRRCAVP